MKTLIPILLFTISTIAFAQPSTIDEANTLLAEGKFDLALTSFQDILKTDPKNIEANQQAARISLYGNKLNEAMEYCSSVLAENGKDSICVRVIAEALHREDRYADASPFYRLANQEPSALQMESFKEQVPYKVVSKKETYHIKFVATDPLPLLNVRLMNSTEDLLFILDTGGGDVIVDIELAKNLNLRNFGKSERMFAGGNRAMIELGRVDKMKVGDLTIENIPVSIQSTSRYSAVAGGKKVSGIIGTVFLYHFLSSIDYPNGQLILRPRDRNSNLKNVKSTQPFWMASTHIMVAQGKINSMERLLFVDTGLAAPGISFTCPESIIKEANIKPIQGQAFVGQGGGGQVQVIPFQLQELSMGSIQKKDVLGITGAFPQRLEDMFGFRISGLVSHGFFRESILTFDFDEMKIMIQ